MKENNSRYDNNNSYKDEEDRYSSGSYDNGDETYYEDDCYGDARYDCDNGRDDEDRYDNARYDGNRHTNDRYDSGWYDGSRYDNDDYGTGRFDYDRHDDRYGFSNNGNIMDNLGEWMQDIVQSTVDNMNFDGLNESIHNAVERARYELTRQVQGQQKGGAREASWMGTNQTGSGRYQTGNGRYRAGYEQEPRDSRERKPVAQRQPKGWLKKIPGRWSGLMGMILGGASCAVFGALSLLMALGTVVTGAYVAGFVTECIFVPVTIASGYLFARGRNAGKRVKRIQQYARQWGGQSYVMLEDLATRTGYSLKLIRKDVHFILDRHLIQDARLDENQTCLMLTEEAGKQYDEAMRSRMERERIDRETAKEREKAQQDMEREKTRQAQLSEEERRMNDLQEKATSCLQEIRGRKDRIQTREVKVKIDRLEILLSRVFVCVKEYSENLSQVERLMEYYLPSVMKLIRVYEDMEKQPIQTDNIQKTRAEIEASLDTVYQGLEAMYDDLFQDVAMDISSDIRVLEAMLAKDGWGGPSLHSSGEKRSIFDEP
ncbi:MAG: 5-bromo-4-chloroindolyl phosphate hydrolysis family protein [Clostridiales bacterium]|nr:5-bromo-4-chloroindolyl phosphate hydrolysis family protein [Clostridiales bacterium]